MENFDIALVAKFLAGEASAEERLLVKKLKKANPKAFKDFQKIWTAGEASNFDPTIRFDKDAAWKKTLAQIDLPETAASSPQTARVRGLGYWLTRVAAVLIVGLAASYLLRPGTPDAIKEVQFFAEAKKQTLELPDGSAIDLRQGGNVTYPANFEEDRSISLEGVAFFDVAKDKVHPFTIKTDRLLITVTGTSFYVDETKEAVGVSTGSVRVEDRNTGQSILLSPGQSVNYDAKRKALSSITPTVENQLFWKTGTLFFKDQSLDTVFTILESSYGAVFEYNEEATRRCRFTGRYKDATLATIVGQLEASLSIEISKQDSLYYIVPTPNCE
jgi:ferric-dicitrate binding protein FerR (iron transport regulator)